MKLTIAIAASAFLLSGCLESSSSKPADTQTLETTTGTTTIGGTDSGGTTTIGGTDSGGTTTIGGTDSGGTTTIGGTDSGGTTTIGGTDSGGTTTIGGTDSGGTTTIGGTDSGGTQPQSAVASMLVNDQDREGNFQTFWSCSSIADNELFEVVLSDSGEGFFQSDEFGSAAIWSERTNGTISVNLTDVDLFVEWTNFNFISLFEFTADLYQDGALVETDRCNLLDVEEEPDTGGGEVSASENFFVTAQSTDDPDAARFIWACFVQEELIFFTFYADKTGLFLFSDEDGEIEVLSLDDWQFANGSLAASSPGFTGSLVSLNGVSTGSSDSFTATETIVGGTSLGEADCLKFDSDDE